MEGSKRGYIEIIIGMILFFIVLGVGIAAASMVGSRYAPELGYLYILTSMISGLTVGLLSGILILSGYLRVSDKRK